MFRNSHGQKSVHLTTTMLTKFMETQPISMPPFSLTMLMLTLPGAIPMVTAKFLCTNQPHVDQNLHSGDQKEKQWLHGPICSPMELKSPTTLSISCSSITKTLIWMVLEVSVKTNSESPTQKWPSSPPTLKWTFLIPMAMVYFKETN